MAVFVIECPNCHIENPEGMKFCRECAQPLGAERVCPQCGHINSLDSKFCNQCAHLFTEEPLAQTPETPPSLPASPSPEATSFAEGRHRFKKLSGGGGIRFLMLWRKTTTRFTRAGYFAPIVFLVITLIITLPTVISHFAPTYVDQMGHLFRLWFLTDSVLNGDLLPQWMPDWYIGMDAFRYYPPLVTYLMLPINLITGNPVDTYYIFGALLLYGTCLSAYYFARLLMSRWPAFIAALVFALSPMTTSIYWHEGNLGRALSALIAPFVFALAYKMLRNQRRVTCIVLVLSTTLLILAHAMQAYMFLFLLGVWLLIIGLFPERRWRELSFTATALLLGVGLSLFWLLPATTHVDLPNVPGIFIDKLFDYSITFSSFSSGTMETDPLIYFSPIALVFAIAGGVITLRSNLRWISISLIVVTFAGLILSFGTNLGDWMTRVPVFNKLLPSRFLLAALLPAVVLIGMWFQSLASKVRLPVRPVRLQSSFLIVLVIITIALLVWNYLPGLNMINEGRPALLEDFSTYLAEETHPGRAIIFSKENSSPSYWLTVGGNKPQAFGWAVEGTIHQDTQPLMNKAIVEDDTEYLENLFRLWQVNYAILGGDQIPMKQQLFSDTGFVTTRETTGTQTMPYILMKRENPLTPAFSFNMNTLAIGVGAAGLSGHLPWITRGDTDSLEDHDSSYLEHFDVIILWEPVIKDRQRFEAIITELAASGTDVYISPGRNVGNLAFGVSSEKVPMSGVCQVRNEASPPVSDDEALELTLPADWYGHIYYRTDGTDIMLDGSEQIPLLQHKIVGGEKVYFIGAAMLCLLDTTSELEAKMALESMLSRSHPYTDPTITPLPSEVTHASDVMTVEIATSEDGWVILSESYSPSWDMYLDDSPLAYYNIENMLAFYLPAGQHTVKGYYGLTTLQIMSIMLSFVSLIAVFLMLHIIRPFRISKTTLRNIPWRTGHGEFHHESAAGEETDICRQV